MELRIGESFRNYTPAGIARFRELRPDVALVADEAYSPVRDYQPRDIQNTLPPWPGVAGNLPAPMLAPCSPAQATEHQAAWSKALKRDVASMSALGMKFALIPPGEFDMILPTASGLSARDLSQPVVRTRVPRPFELSTMEVTCDQFRQFVDATGYVTAAEKRPEGGSVYGGVTRAGAKPTWRNPTGQPAHPGQPVTQVTADDALAFCAWLSQTQNAPCRLPTEAEFMHALLAGSQSRYSPADRAENADRVAIFGSAPALVGSREANPFGLFDMVGNVWEFCEASGAAGLFDAESRRPFPRRYNVVRGLGFDETIQGTCWRSVLWSEPQNNVGFRVLRELSDLKGVEAAPAPGDAGQLVRRGQPLSSKALVPNPAPIAGLRSWSVELKSPQSRGTVSVLAAQPTGNLVATGNNFGKISLWDQRGHLRQVLLGHEGVIHSLDFSADGNWLVSCDRFAGPAGSTARVWEVATGRQATILPIPGWCWGATINADGSRVAAIAPGGVLLWDRSTQKVSTAANIRDLAALTWAPDGAQLIGSHGNLKLRVYDATTLESIREADGPATQYIKVSPDGRWLAVGTDDAGVAIWERETLTPVRTLAKENAAQRSRAFAWLPDSRHIAMAFEAHPSAIYDAASGKEVVKLPIPSYSIAIRDSGREVVLDGGYGPVFVDASTGRLLREAPQVWPAGTARLAPNDREIWCAIGSDLAVHDAETGQRLRSVHVPLGESFEWMTSEASPAGDRAALVSARPSLPVIDPASGEVVRTLMHGSANVHQAAWSPDGKTLATTASDHLVRIWNMETGAIDHTLKGHTDKVWSVAWSRDGRRLASAAEDQSVRIWDTSTGKSVATFDRLPETMPSGAGASRNLVWADTRRLWIGLRSSITQLDVEGGWFTPVENFSQGNNVDNLTLAPNGRQMLIHEAYNFTFLRGWGGRADRSLLGDALGGDSYRPHTWHPDSRRFLADQMTFGVQAYDAERFHRLGHFFPQIESLSPDDSRPRRHWLCLGPTGHVRGGPCDAAEVVAGLGHRREQRWSEPRATTEGLPKPDAAANDAQEPTTETLAALADLIVYVALHDDGSQGTYSPDEFAQKFNWHNDPDRATLLKLNE
jgi:WD40 repeat protein/formylglycine-generating enzyme required for sulfatase activity